LYLLPAAVSRGSRKDKRLEVQDLYLAHLALSDLMAAILSRRTHQSFRAQAIAAVNESLGRIWNGNWQIQWRGSDQDCRPSIRAFNSTFALHPENLRSSR